MRTPRHNLSRSLWFQLYGLKARVLVPHPGHFALTHTARRSHSLRQDLIHYCDVCGAKLLFQVNLSGPLSPVGWLQDTVFLREGRKGLGSSPFHWDSLACHSLKQRTGCWASGAKTWKCGYKSSASFTFSKVQKDFQPCTDPHWLNETVRAEPLAHSKGPTNANYSNDNNYSISDLYLN